MLVILKKWQRWQDYRNFESLNTLLSNLEEVTSFETSTMQENNTDYNLENSCLAYNVIMVELPPHQDDKEQLDPLPKDSPVVMVETEPGVCNLSLSVKGLKKRRTKAFKGHLLSDFQHSLSITSNSPCHCMTWILEENAQCKGHSEMCNNCFERYLLFQDVHTFINNTRLTKNRKAHYHKLLGSVEAKIHSSSCSTKVPAKAILESHQLVYSWSCNFSL